MRKPVLIFRILLIAFLGWALLPGRAGSEEDLATAWKQWKDISSAILIRPLDGPEDILEKAEIIEDRHDQLTRERNRLKEAREKESRRLESWENQREVLQELESFGRGKDLESRQRLLDLTEQIQQERNLLARLDESLEEIEGEISKYHQLANQYRDKAKHLRVQEEKQNEK